MRSTHLTVSQMFDLEHACRMLSAAFGHNTYLVGSVLLRPDWRDVDLRCMLEDAEYDAMVGPNIHRLKLLNTSISEWLAARTGLPIDFQFQRQTEANTEFDETRQFMGRPLNAAGGAA